MWGTNKTNPCDPTPLKAWSMSTVPTHRALPLPTSSAPGKQLWLWVLRSLAFLKKIFYHKCCKTKQYTVFHSLLLSFTITFPLSMLPHLASCRPSVFTVKYLTKSVFDSFPTPCPVGGHLDYFQISPSWTGLCVHAVSWDTGTKIF